MTFDGCNASMSITDPFFGSEIDTDFELDGNSLKTSVRVTLFGLAVNCSFEGTK